MSGDIPIDHPRRASLLKRGILTDAASEGILADSALIAHGRGEAFDYLLGESTSPAAVRAINEAVAVMREAERCVISVNGNAVALAPQSMWKMAALLGCPIEVNIFHRTEERMRLLLEKMEREREAIFANGWENGPTEWKQLLKSVALLGGEPDALILGIEGNRAHCHSNGIHSADVVFVPLEDGDRCNALVSMGKKVVVVDLNPLSRTSQTASVTIVDELTRVGVKMVESLMGEPFSPSPGWDNMRNLKDSLSVMLDAMDLIEE